MEQKAKGETSYRKDTYTPQVMRRKSAGEKWRGGVGYKRSERKK